MSMKLKRSSSLVALQVIRELIWIQEEAGQVCGEKSTRASPDRLQASQLAQEIPETQEAVGWKCRQQKHQIELPCAWRAGVAQPGCVFALPCLHQPCGLQLLVPSALCLCLTLPLSTAVRQLGHPSWVKTQGCCVFMF